LFQPLQLGRVGFTAVHLHHGPQLQAMSIRQVCSSHACCKDSWTYLIAKAAALVFSVIVALLQV
jgi:hypothetical protein